MADVNGTRVQDIQVANGWVQIGGGTPQVLEETYPSFRMNLTQKSSIQNLRVVPLDFGKGAIAPTFDNIQKGAYPLWFNFYLLNKNQ